MKNYIVIDYDLLQVIRIKGRQVVFNSFYQWDGSREGLHAIIKSLPFPLKRVALLVPGNHFYIKSLVLPISTAKQLDGVIKYDFLAKLPLAPEELYYSSYSRNKGQQLQVVVFAVKKDLLEQFCRLIREVGLLIKGVFPLAGLYYLSRLNLSQESGEQRVLWAETNSWYQHYILLSEEEIYIRGCRDKTAVAIREELEQTYRYWQGNRADQAGHRLVLNGRELACSELAGWEQLPLLNAKSRLWEELAQFSREIKQLDLLSKTESAQLRQRKQSYLSISLLVFIVILTWGVTTGVKWSAAQKELNKLEQLAERTEQQVVVVNELKTAYQTVEEKLLSYQEILARNNHCYLPWLLELSRIIPTDLEIDSLSLKEDKLLLLAGRTASAASLLEELEKSPLFENLHFIGRIISKQGKEEFRMAGDLRYAAQ